MPILNYTTTISTDKTFIQIQKILLKGKANAVLCEYEKGGEMCSISFRLVVNDCTVMFKLPAHIDKIYTILQNDFKIKRPCMKSRDQAARIAWRIRKDWLEAQFAIIEAEQAELLEVFLPYAQKDNGQTVFETIKNNGFKALANN